MKKLLMFLGLALIISSCRVIRCQEPIPNECVEPTLEVCYLNADNSLQVYLIKTQKGNFNIQSSPIEMNCINNTVSLILADCETTTPQYDYILEAKTTNTSRRDTFYNIEILEKGSFSYMCNGKKYYTNRIEIDMNQ